MYRENLEHYNSRINGFIYNSLPRNQELLTHPSLNQKVDKDGCFRPYWGNTLYFELCQKDRDLLSRIQQQLYHKCGSCLAEPLHPDSFHLTLHDLVNGCDPGRIASAMDEIGRCAQQKLEAIAAHSPKRISLKTDHLFNMVNTSVVMGLRPASEEDCAALMGLYDAFQQIYSLNYPLTLHITLAYYRPGIYTQDMVCTLDDMFRSSSEYIDMPIELKLENLHYRRFSDMKTYF